MKSEFLNRLIFIFLVIFACDYIFNQYIRTTFKKENAIKFHIALALINSKSQLSVLNCSLFFLMKPNYIDMTVKAKSI